MFLADQGRRLRQEQAQSAERRIWTSVMPSPPRCTVATRTLPDACGMCPGNLWPDNGFRLAVGNCRYSVQELRSKECFNMQSEDRLVQPFVQ